jgi:hypothetical protein
MNNKFLIHGCWAAAVLLAFSLGSRRSGVTSSPRTGASTTSPVEAANPPSNPSGSLSRNSQKRPASRGVSAIEGLFGTVNASGADLNALIAQALRDPNPITRRLAFSRLLESLTPGNAEVVREQLVALGADPDQWRDFHYAWGALDGRAAYANAAQSPEDDLNATMSGWAAANPGEALAMLDNLPAELLGQRDDLVASVVSGLSHNDPGVATAYVLRLGQEGNPKAGELMETVAVATVSQLGPEAGSRWVESLADGPLKGNAMAKVAEAYVRRDPEAAARWTEGFADKDFASRTIEQVGARWAESNPVAAVGWLESLPASPGQKQGLSGAFGDWEDRDPVAAGDYLYGMAKSPQRDAAISGFASGYAWQDPQTAIAWAKDIDDPALRESSLTRAGQAFYRRDPEGALAWLEGSGLSEEARQRVTTSERRR